MSFHSVAFDLAGVALHLDWVVFVTRVVLVRGLFSGHDSEVAHMVVPVLVVVEGEEVVQH